MAKIDRLTEKIEKLGKKQNLGALLKIADDPKAQKEFALMKKARKDALATKIFNEQGISL